MTMPRDVHKSLELLEEYHADLFRPSDIELKSSVERVIGVFKTNLFNSLCDIQDFYDNVLLNERLSMGEKISASRRFAERWQQVSASIPPQAFPTMTSQQGVLPLGATTTTTTTTKHQYYSSDTASHHTVVSRPGSGMGGSGGGAPPALLSSSTLNRVVDEMGREWEVEEVLLDASQSGLGFSISGGRDRDPDPDYGIRVTDIAPGGAVARDGRVRIGDVILKVNGNDCVDVSHQTAVEYLERAGPYVRLLVKRLRPLRSASQSQLAGSGAYLPPTSLKGSRSLHQLPTITPTATQPVQIQYGPPSLAGDTSMGSRLPRYVTLRKGNQGLGFNIVGGEDGEPIYVSHVLSGGPANMSGDVRKGDVLLSVGDIDLQGVTHGQAALALKSVPNNSYVRLMLQYRPREYHQFENKVERLRQDLLFQQQASMGRFPQARVA